MMTAKEGQGGMSTTRRVPRPAGPGVPLVLEPGVPSDSHLPGSEMARTSDICARNCSIGTKTRGAFELPPRRGTLKLMTGLCRC